MAYSLSKSAGAYGLDTTTRLRFGLRWEAKSKEAKGLRGWAEKKKREIEGTTDPADWDAGAIFLTGGDPKKYIGFDNFEPFKDEATQEERLSAKHSGDSVRGDGDGDDEQVDLDLTAIPRRYDSILLVGGAAKKGATFDAVRDVKATIYDGSDGKYEAVGEYEPSLLGSKRMIAMARLDRGDNGTWTLSVVGESFDVTPGDFRSLLRGALQIS